MNSKPKMVRTLLIAMILAVFILSIAGFFFGYIWLNDEADKTNQAIVKNSVSKMSDTSLNKLKSELESLTQTVNKIDSMYTTNDNFQKTAIADVTRYATISNIGKVSFDFESSSATSNSTKQFTISLADTVSYSSFVQFLQLIDSNLPKMKVDSFTISPAPDYNKDKAIVKDLKISIYVR